MSRESTKSSFNAYQPGMKSLVKGSFQSEAPLTHKSAKSKKPECGLLENDRIPFRQGIRPIQRSCWRPKPCDSRPSQFWVWTLEWQREAQWIQYYIPRYNKPLDLLPLLWSSSKLTFMLWSQPIHRPPGYVSQPWPVWLYISLSNS